MKTQDGITVWLLTLLNIAAGLMMAGVVAHLCWYVLTFGWDLVP